MTRLKIRALRRLFARHRFLVLAEAVFFWLLAAAAFYWMVGYFIVPFIAESRIEHLCGGAATIQSGHFEGFGGIHLTGVVLGTDADDLTGTPFLQADTIEIQFKPWHLLRGRFTVSSVKLRDFLVTVDYDPQTKHFNVADFSPGPADVSKRSNIPLILLDRGAVRLRTAAEQGYQEVTTMTVNGTVAEKTAKNEYGFSLETDGRFGYGPSRFQGGLRLGKKGQGNQFWLSGRMQMPKSGVLQNQWDLRDVKLECRFDEQSVNIETCHFSLGDGRGEVTGRIHYHDERQIELNVRLDEFELSEYPRPDAVVYARLKDFVDPGLEQFLSGYHPNGTADVDMTINGTLKNLAKAKLDGRIHCRDISIFDDMFPYRMNHLNGDILFTGRSLRLDGLKGRHGDVNLQIDGTVDNFGPETAIDMRFTSPNIRLDADLYHAIAAPARDPNGVEAKMWHEISPSGIAELDYHFQQAPDGQESQQTTLRLIDVSAMYKGFPYPLRHLTGTVLFKEGKIQLEKIVSKYDGDAQIELNGQLSDYSTPQRNYHMTCRGTGIPIDRILIEAFPVQQRSFLDPDLIKATTDFEVKIFPSPTHDDQPDFIAKVEVQGQKFAMKDVPLPMTDVELSAIITRDLVRISRFDANTESGHIRLLDESKVWPRGKDPNRPAYSLRLDVHNFQLNDAFWKGTGPDADQVLGSLRLGGAIDANGLLGVNLNDGTGDGTDLTIMCKDNPLRWDTAPLGYVHGQFTVKGKDVVFQDFALEEMPLESFPPELMNQKAKTVHEQLRPKGTIGLHIPKGMMRMGPKGPLFIDIDISIETASLAIGQSDPPHRLTGMCQGHYVIDVPSGRWQMTAHYDIDQFYYQNWQVTDITGDLNHDPDTGTLQSRDFKGRFYEGQVTGTLVMNLGEQTDYKLELDYEAINLAKLPPLGNKKVQLPSATSGTADGSVILTAPLDALSQARGKFTADIANLEMGRQSLLGKILTAVQFKQPEAYIFYGIDLSAEIRAPELVFDRIRIIGSPLIFDGMGTVNLKTREVAVELSVWDRIVSDRQSILDMLARGIGSALWRVEMRGTLDEPLVNAVFLSIFKQPLNILKKEGD